MSRPQPRWYRGLLLVPFYDDDGETLICWDIHPDASQYGDFDSDDAYRQSLDCEPLEENLPTLAAAKAAATDLTLLDRIRFRVGGRSI